jgi:hypothetical protein
MDKDGEEEIEYFEVTKLSISPEISPINNGVSIEIGFKVLSNTPELTWNVKVSRKKNKLHLVCG